MHVQDAVSTLPDNAGHPPRRPAQPEKKQSAVKAVGLSKLKKVDSQKPPGSKNSTSMWNSGTRVGKVGSSTRADAAKKNSAGMGTAIG